LELELGAIMA